MRRRAGTDLARRRLATGSSVTWSGGGLLWPAVPPVIQSLSAKIVKVQKHTSHDVYAYAKLQHPANDELLCSTHAACQVSISMHLLACASGISQEMICAAAAPEGSEEADLRAGLGFTCSVADMAGFFGRPASLRVTCCATGAR